MPNAPDAPESDSARSQRERTESALEQSEQRFQSVVQSAPDGVAILRGATILYLNPRGARMLGLETPEAGIGRRITEFIESDQSGDAAERIRDLLRTGNQAETPHEYRSHSLDGRTLVVEISSIRIEFLGGPAVLAFARDVTERKALQARVAQAERLSALGVLSAGVAHEINNPLAYVLLNLEFLEQYLDSTPDGPERELLLKRVLEAKHGADRVATIVRDLRTFARDDATSRGAVSVETTLETAINLVSASLATRARLIRRYRPVSLVLGNAARLEQVFVNLLVNAAQAIPEGGSPETHAITVAVSESEAGVQVAFTDTGVGMPEETKQQIFDPFFTTKAPGVGTGLGLPICQGIVRAHGGSLNVDTTEGEGSTFTVTLPKFVGVPMVSEPEQPAPRGDQGRGRVLIVNDDVNVGKTLSLALQPIHDITVVTSGPAALAELRAARGSYDAILCDVLMPGMTGRELFDAARDELPELDARFIFMSGALFTGGTAELAATSRNRVLEKPFDIQQVRDALQSVVARVRQRSSREP